MSGVLYRLLLFLALFVFFTSHDIHGKFNNGSSRCCASSSTAGGVRICDASRLPRAPPGIPIEGTPLAVPCCRVYVLLPYKGAGKCRQLVKHLRARALSQAGSPRAAPEGSACCTLSFAHSTCRVAPRNRSYAVIRIVHNTGVSATKCTYVRTFCGAVFTTDEEPLEVACVRYCSFRRLNCFKEIGT